MTPPPPRRQLRSGGVGKSRDRRRRTDPGNEPSPPLHGVSEGPGSTQSAPSATDVPESHGAASDVIICYRAVSVPAFPGRGRGCEADPMSTDDQTGLLPDDHRNLFVAGTWRPASGGARFDVLDPADGSVITDVADGSAKDAMAALDAAADAQHDWARTPPRERGEILRRAYEIVMDRADEFARIDLPRDGQDAGRGPGEVAYGAEFFRWFSEEAVRIHGRWMQAPGGRQPAADDAQAGRPVPVRHAVELPDRDGHPQDRAGRRRRLHDGRQARRADAADDAGAGRGDGRGRAARRRAQRRHHLRLGRA